MRALVATVLLAWTTSQTAHGQSAVVFHQDTSLYVFGAVSDYQTEDSLPGTRIRITELPGGTNEWDVESNASGKYDFYLGRAKRYRITYSRPDRLAKHVEIDAASVPDTSWHGGMAMEVNMTLRKPFPGSDNALFNEAIGKSRYNPATNLLEWDLDYTTRMRERMEAYMAQGKEEK